MNTLGGRLLVGKKIFIGSKTVIFPAHRRLFLFNFCYQHVAEPASLVQWRRIRRTTQNPPATGGCAVGILDYYNFTYIPLINGPLASTIAVAPTAGSGFTFGPVTAAPGQEVKFEIDYDMVIDPAPIVTGR